MKVKIRKAQPGETPRFISKLNKFIKKAGGQSDTIDAYIDSELSNGTSPEEVISALVEFKIPREKIEDIVYEMYDTLQESNNYDPSTETAPYDKESPYSKKVKDKVKVEEVVDEIPESEKYGYYDSNNLGSKLSKETDFDEDGEYAEGGQYMNDNVIPESKQPYFVGMDANAVPASFAFGGSKQSKSKYIKDYIKKLKKAAEGNQVENSEFYLPPAGSIGDPMGNNTKQNQMFAGTVKQMGNEAMMKKQAEESYQNMNTKANGGSQEPHDWVDELHGYGEALQHSMTAMDENAINTAIMKKEYGRGGRIRRANRALFGTPHSIPGVNTSYEFGPLGGIRKATADWDVKALGNLVNFLPGAYGMMPGMNSGNWKSVSYPSQVRQKVITSVNNTALDEVANNTKSSSATQGHLSSNKKGLNCPPGAVYDASSDQCIGPDGLPVSLLENPFANPYASMIPGSYQNQKQQNLNKFIPTAPTNNINDGTIDPVDPSQVPYTDNMGVDPMAAYGMQVGKYMDDGGYVDQSMIDPNNPELLKFIYGGDEYAYGGGIQRFGPGGGFDSWAKDKFNIDGSSKFKPNAGNPELINPFAKTHTQGVPNENLIGANSSNAFSNIPGSNTKQPDTTTTNNTAPGQQQFTQQQIEQFLQYKKSQQGQPGSGVYAPGYGVNSNMMYGPPKKLGFGFSKDFSYTQGFSPNWNVPEGTEHMRQETYKDRGNKFNPFDNKRVTDWYADGAKDPATSVDMEDTATVTPGTNDTPGADGTTPGTNSGDYSSFKNSTQRKIARGERRAARQEARGRAAFPEDYADGPSSPDDNANEPDVLNPSSPAVNPQVNMNAPGRPADPNLTIGNPGVPVVGATNTTYQSSAPQTNAVNPSNPLAPADPNLAVGNPGVPVVGATNTTYQPSSSTQGTSQPQQPVGNAQGASLSNPGLGNPFLQNNGLQNSTGAPVNQFGVIRRQQGGFIPSYAQFLEYGGYLQEAKSGITVDQPEFNDPNFVGRTITQNAYTFDPKQMGADLFGKASVTDIFTKGAKSWGQAKQDEASREQVRSSDAASPNTGQSGFGSAEIAGSQMGDAGWYNQYGKQIQKIGDEGNNVNRKIGGTPNKQYQKGRVYTLTLKQIKEIEAAGGKIEYLK